MAPIFHSHFIEDDMNSLLGSTTWQRRPSFRLLMSGAALCACVLALALPMQAQETTDEKDGDVSIGSIKILTVRFPAGDMTIKQRAAAITDRLISILSDARIRPSDITIQPVGKEEAKIVVKDRLLVTVDARTAQFNHTKAMD